MIITEDILDETVPKEMIPTRLDSALNLYTVVLDRGKPSLILYNTNPDTWNTLYSFYEANHKFTMDEYYINISEPTYRDLLTIMKEAYTFVHENEKGFNKEKRMSVLKSEFIKTFSLNDVSIGDELKPIYELKYSKSKNVWTLYYLENYVANAVDNLDKLLNQDVYVQKIVPIDSKSDNVQGIPIASNIVTLLSKGENAEILRKNILK